MSTATDNRETTGGVSTRLLSTVQAVYDRVLRPYVPRTMGTMAGVPVPASETDRASYRVLDLTRHRPEYKQGLLDAVHEHVYPGDDVGIIGLGRGVSTVHTVRAGGSVTAYEAAGEMIQAAEQTLEWQGIRDQVSTVHGVVSTPGGEVYGDDLGDTVPASELAHEVLVLDCEGAELAILPALDTLPETVIVETHPRQDAPTRDTRQVLVEHGYEVAAREYEPGEDNPQKHVLVATRRGDIQ